MVFNGILLRLFFKKKTIGTALLLVFHSCITIAEILNTFGLWYFAFVSEESILSKISELAFVLFYAVGYLFLYIFANRHILQDNDIVKGLTTTILSLIVGIIFGIMIGEIINYFTFLQMKMKDQ